MIDDDAAVIEPAAIAASGHSARTPGTRIAVETSFSRGFVKWLMRHRVGMVTSTYQSGHIMFVGAGPDEKPVLTAAAFTRAMGLSASSQRIYVGAANGIWRLENMLASDELANDMFDRLYLPRNAQVTGEIDIHELAVEPSGRIIFANTAYSCLATVSATHAFKPIWTPKFVSRLAAEDRCHLNGIGMENGAPRYVSRVGSNY